MAGRETVGTNGNMSEGHHGCMGKKGRNVNYESVGGGREFYARKALVKMLNDIGLEVERWLPMWKQEKRLLSFWLGIRMDIVVTKYQCRRWTA